MRNHFVIASHLEEPCLGDVELRDLHHLSWWHDIEAELLAEEVNTGL